MRFIKEKLIKLHWGMASQLGLDPLLFLRSLRGLPAYVREWFLFRRSYAGEMKIMPCLHDRYEEAGATKSEYFWQDLIVARAVYQANPLKHVDVGSRVDGFVAHVASFRECEVIDVRRMTTKIPGVTFLQADLMDLESLPNTADGGYCDSLSCLHAVEHFGLGRYGDPINPKGYELGIANMSSLLRPKGRLYLAAPIGKERVEFNANWVFDPRTLLRCAKKNGLHFASLTIVSGANGPHTVVPSEEVLEDLAARRYSLGIFVFTKH